MSCRTLQDADKKTQIRDLLKKLRESIIAANAGGGQGVVEGEISNTDVSPVSISTPLTTSEMVNINPVSTEVAPQPPLTKEK
jgi:hypothetical protein